MCGHQTFLPVIKELVELLFQEGLVKALFATETVRFYPSSVFFLFLSVTFGMILRCTFLQFAMGLNMPAKTVIFTAVKKWDGDSHRYIGSGEYIQVRDDIFFGRWWLLIYSF